MLAAAQLSCGSALEDESWDKFEPVAYSVDDVAAALGAPVGGELAFDRIPCAPSPFDANITCGWNGFVTHEQFLQI